MVLRQQGELTCAPQVFPSLAFMRNQMESKPDTPVRGGLAGLLSSYPALIYTDRGKKGLDEPGMSCTGAGRELCCSAQKPSVPLREGAELCGQTCSRHQKKCRAELLGPRLLWLCPPSCREPVPSFVCTIVLSAQHPIQSELRAGAAVPEFELCVCTDTLLF